MFLNSFKWNFSGISIFNSLQQGFINFSGPRRPFLIKIFPWRPSLSNSSYIKTNTVFGLSKPFVYISEFFESVKVKFFRIISKQIPYLVSLNTLVLESIKISWELIVYFSMKIKNSDHRGDPLYMFQIFWRVSKWNFSV